MQNSHHVIFNKVRELTIASTLRLVHTQEKLELTIESCRYVNTYIFTLLSPKKGSQELAMCCRVQSVQGQTHERSSLNCYKLDSTASIHLTRPIACPLAEFVYCTYIPTSAPKRSFRTLSQCKVLPSRESSKLWNSSEGEKVHPVHRAQGGSYTKFTS